MTICAVGGLARQRIKVDATLLPGLILNKSQQRGKLEMRSIIRTRKARVVVPFPELVTKFQGMFSLEQGYDVSPVVIVLNEGRWPPRPVDTLLTAVDADIRHMEGNAATFAAAALHTNLAVTKIV